MIKDQAGDIITLALKGEFDVIVNGIDCEGNNEGGFPYIMKAVFQTDKFPMEDNNHDINKLGCIDFKLKNTHTEKKVWVVNMYQEYSKTKKGAYGIPFDYDAFRLCLRKLNAEFKNQIIAMISSIGDDGNAQRSIIRKIIEQETRDCKIILMTNQID